MLSATTARSARTVCASAPSHAPRYARLCAAATGVRMSTSVRCASQPAPRKWTSRSPTMGSVKETSSVPLVQVGE
jgi:hypothetical protein